jgi:hypothetical protein
MSCGQTEPEIRSGYGSPGVRPCWLAEAADLTCYGLGESRASWEAARHTGDFGYDERAPHRSRTGQKTAVTWGSVRAFQPVSSTPMNRLGQMTLGDIHHSDMGATASRQSQSAAARKRPRPSRRGALHRESLARSFAGRSEINAMIKSE